MSILLLVVVLGTDATAIGHAGSEGIVTSVNEKRVESEMRPLKVPTDKLVVHTDYTLIVTEVVLVTGVGAVVTYDVL